MHGPGWPPPPRSPRSRAARARHPPVWLQAAPGRISAPPSGPATPPVPSASAVRDRHIGGARGGGGVLLLSHFAASRKRKPAALACRHPRFFRFGSNRRHMFMYCAYISSLTRHAACSLRDHRPPRRRDARGAPRAHKEQHHTFHTHHAHLRHAYAKRKAPCPGGQGAKHHGSREPQTYLLFISKILVFFYRASKTPHVSRKI